LALMGVAILMLTEDRVALEHKNSIL